MLKDHKIKFTKALYPLTDAICRSIDQVPERHGLCIPLSNKQNLNLEIMKNLLLLAAGGVVLYQVAKHFKINSLDDLKKVALPQLKELTALVNKN
ncbi:MAG: hypothetical protein K0S12_2561 [Bacteroidetes bacterium]|jgi:hypothetical protein|nr:hypothetical protein [Bacteroidota bacterium]